MSDGSAMNDGDAAWVLMSTALVFIMIPGLGYFYSGLARHKNALSLLFLSVLSMAVVSIQWYVWGYSLAFSATGGSFVGNLQNAFLMQIFIDGEQTYSGLPHIPEAVFMVYQGMFAAITPAVAFGSAAERIRVLPCAVFLFLWSTLVYDFVAYWTWAPAGWLRVLGSYDFAGGTPVHISSGAAGLAFALVTGKRIDYGKEPYRPHNLSSVFLGTALLWFGWFGFNGGSALGANTRAAIAVVNTNIAACAGGLTWTVMDYRHSRKISAFAFCSGVVSGLVTVTPGCGFIPVWGALLCGILGAISCNTFVTLKDRFGFDDALDVFAVHGVGGIVGGLLTGLFASKRIVALDGTDAPGGWIDGHYAQLGYQVAGIVAGFAWSFFVTYIICFVMDKIPYLNLRLSAPDEAMGTDRAQMGETAYDYIEAAVQSFNMGSDAEPSQSTNHIIEMKELVPKI